MIRDLYFLVFEISKMNLNDAKASKPENEGLEKELEKNPENEKPGKVDKPEKQDNIELTEEKKEELIAEKPEKDQEHSTGIPEEIISTETKKKPPKKKNTSVDIAEENPKQAEESESIDAISDTPPDSEDIKLEKDGGITEEVKSEVKDDTGKEKEEETKENQTEQTLPEENNKKEEIKLPKLNLDYNNFSREELLQSIKDLVSLHPVQRIKNDVDNIKICFYKCLKSENEEKKKKFVEDGNAVEDFQSVTDNLEDEFKAYLKRYKELKYDHNRELESEKKENLTKKYEIIKQISNLVNTQESINKTFNEFKDLQKTWYDIGPVPQPELNRLWETYHHHVERFYDYVNINKELRDLDLKKNLEKKVKLCLRAEELLKEQSPIKAFKELQKLHALWREIGPVNRDSKEDIWARFKETTTFINKAHQQHYELIREGQKKNLDEKTKLCEQVEEISNLEIKNHKEWDLKSKEIIEIQKIWKTIGFAPLKDNNLIYRRFRTACDIYFKNKREYYSKNKEIQSGNLKKKTELCEKAESFQESTDWKNTTNDLIKIQKEWKEIGPVARKNSDAIWKRFRKACDTFFDKKSEHFLGLGDEQEENLKLKLNVIKSISEIQPSEEHRVDLKKLKVYEEEWAKIGHVPYKDKDNIIKKYRDAVEKVYSELKMDDSSKSLLRFRQKIEQIGGDRRGNSKLFYEREKLANKLKLVESDIVIWENNIGFFTKSKSSEAMIKEISLKIEKGRKNIEILRGKINLIDNIESNQK